MVTDYYLIMLLISILLTVYFVYIWNKHFDINITMIFIMVPLMNLAYIFTLSVGTVDEFLNYNKIIYLGGCFLPYFISMAICNLCDIKVTKFWRVFLFIVNMIMYGFVLSTGATTIFYKHAELIEESGQPVLIKQYGPVHTIFYMIVIAYFLWGIGVIIYCYINNRQISKKMLSLLFLPLFISVIGFFGNNFVGRRIEILPLTYTFAQFVYILVIRKMSLYNTNEMVIESMVQSGDVGYILTDLSDNYLGSNKTAKAVFPFLGKIRIDSRIDDLLIKGWIEQFKRDGVEKKLLYKKDDAHIYRIRVNYLYDGKKARGYHIFINDDTKNQRYITLMNNYNTRLKTSVEEKTQHIVQMHDQFIMGMATMVESRDNSTGGHIRRTSDGVRILIEEIMKDNKFGLTETFCHNIIKAAPMHDLGKIAVDDAILRKPGRFEPWEFEKMKTHAEEGVRIVRAVLEGTDDEEFKLIAENVAHYHHERWDGSGYPHNLVGVAIPLEARIMAIADVYDALVSKRVYKESMSFEDADAIIMDGMGVHFDPALEEYYVKARPKLEEYYKSLQ